MPLAMAWWTRWVSALCTTNVHLVDVDPLGAKQHHMPCERRPICAHVHLDPRLLCPRHEPQMATHDACKGSDVGIPDRLFVAALLGGD